MADILTRSTGQASTTGTVIYTVPANGAATIIGCRMTNTTSDVISGCYFTVAGVQVNGAELDLIPGSAIDIMAGSKIVAVAGDEVVAYAGTDDSIDVYVSYLEQTPDA